MIGFVERFLKKRGWVNRREMKRQWRGYLAANITRLENDWASTEVHVDSDIRNALQVVRTRARDMAANDNYAKAFIRSIDENVVGPNGFTFQSNVKKNNGELNEELNRRIEDAWEDFSEKDNCSMDGVRTMRDLQASLAKGVARDGEALLRIVQTKSMKYGIGLQGIEPELLDHRYSEDLRNGRVIKMGVEVDGWRRPLRYYLLKGTPSASDVYAGSLGNTTYNYSVLSAQELIHGFDREFFNQTRGISWMVQGLWQLKQLRGYIEAAVIASRIGAQQGGFFSDKEGSGNKEFEGDDVDSDGNQILSLEPGTFKYIGNYEFNKFDPDFPQGQYGAFLDKSIESFASGVGMAAMTISANLANANYSSMRAGLLPERDHYRTLQNWFANTFLKPVYRQWMASAVLSGKLNIPDFFTNQEKYIKPLFIGRSWAWVDPEKDVNALKEARKFGVKSRYQIVGEQGGGDRLEDIWKDIQKEEELQKELGLTSITVETSKSALVQEPKVEETEEAKALKRSIEDTRKAQGELFAGIEDVRRTVENQSVILATKQPLEVKSAVNLDSKTIAENLSEALSETVERVLTMPKERRLSKVKRLNGRLEEATVIEQILKEPTNGSSR